MLAMFTAPTIVAAQTSVQDQYEPAPGPGSGNEPGAGGGGAPVNVQAADANGGKLPFTGGSVPLVLLIGLGLLAAGLLGTVATRKRRPSGSL